MFASIRHIAVMTENWDREAKFYQTIFGMKKITNGMTDEKGEYNKNRGHLSDGVIGLALLQRQPGFKSGLDHFGFRVSDLDETVADLKAKGVEFTMEPNVPRPGIKICFIRGPQGISIELLDRDAKYV